MSSPTEFISSYARAFLSAPCFCLKSRSVASNLSRFWSSGNASNSLWRCSSSLALISAALASASCLNTACKAYCFRASSSESFRRGALSASGGGASGTCIGGGLGGSSFRPMRPNKLGGSSFSGSGAPREMTSKEPCDAFLFTRSSSTSSSRNVFGSSSYDSRRHSQSSAALLVVLRAPLLAATAANALAALSSSKPAAVTPANAPARAAPASLSFAVSLVKRLAALPKGQPSSRFNTSPMASCAARDMLLLCERSVSTRLLSYRCVSRVSCTDARPRRRRLAFRPALSPLYP
mmetsp:Transcript_5461/g.15330  ORF Transcript_5461/g.15330 Transcript_5461/m.15330 type:complete len:293 (+) Transcript_5461:2983-3861(+)